MKERQAAEREARTFKHAGIDVVTSNGLVTLTREMAQELKAQMNNTDQIQFIEDNRVAETGKVACRPYEAPKEEVNELDQWEAQKFGYQEDSD